MLEDSPSPFLLTKRGPISTTAPYPMEEHPGPSFKGRKKKDKKNERSQYD